MKHGAKLLAWTCAGILALAGPSVAKKPRTISIADDPTLGERSAALVLVEISDFQCPYCGKGAREVLPRVYEQYVTAGKVELVFLDLPLKMHEHAFQAAEAAQCAGEQNLFWDMHHYLFAYQTALTREDLVRYAGELELEVGPFVECLDSGRHDAAIREDIEVARKLRIQGTPAYVLGRRVPASDDVEVLEVISGLPPYEVLEEKINGLLASP